MLFNKKAVLLLGIAAGYLVYRYSKLSPEEKESLRERGKKLVEDYIPEDVKNIFGKDTGENTKAKSF